MSRLPVRTPIDGAAVGRFIDGAQNGRLAFRLPEVAPVAGIGLAYLTAACRQLAVEHIDFHGALAMTPQQVQTLLYRVAGTGDLTDGVLAETFLRDQVQPEQFGRHLWAVKP